MLSPDIEDPVPDYLLLFALGFAGLAVPLFDLRMPEGLNFRHENSPTPEKFLIEAMGGGVALLDYNNDDLLDVFFVNSGHIAGSGASFDRNNPRYWNRLYRQNKNGAFTDVTQAAGLANAGEGNYGMGVAVADYDNDGYPDLYVTSYGRNILYRNNGNGTFTDVTAKAGVAAGGWSVSAGFFDYDNDGKLDLFVTRYMDWNPRSNKPCGVSPRVYCSPSEFPAIANILYRNRGDGTFEDVSHRSGIDAKKGKALGVAFADYDDDGFSDVFVANDGMEQFLFHNNGNGTFTEKALEAGVALTDDGSRVSGMGVDFRDYDNDGRPDIVITDLAKQNYALYRNDGGGSFSYRSLQSGLTLLSGASSGWGMRLEDFDNDGWKDLFVAQGHVMDNVDRIDPSLHSLEPPMLAMNRDGRFERADCGTLSPVPGRGAAFGDLDNDGWLDVVMTTLGGRPMVFHNLFRNNAAGRHWLTLSLRGGRSNRDGFGARIRVNGQTQYATSAGSYLSASDKRVHFGLGAATTATVEIQWPSGRRQTIANVRADRFLTVTEPE
ncbi:MAG TPA: CRTAC1 family protein [Bryobacteraceae bacterium]|nr:CRTAC1 family protein [Bryobacteraceae bacterium]